MREAECLERLVRQKEFVNRIKEEYAGFKQTQLYKKHGRSLLDAKHWDMVLMEEEKALMKIRAELCDIRGE